MDEALKMEWRYPVRREKLTDLLREGAQSGREKMNRKTR